MTTKEAAIRIMNSSAFVTNKTDEESEGHVYGLVFYVWDFDHGRVVIYLQQGKVYLIEFVEKSKDSMFDRTEDIDITLSQAFNKYGEPEEIFSAFNPDIPAWGSITFFYPKQGIDLAYWSHNERRKYRSILRPETPISSITYYSPENYMEIFEKFYLDKPEWTEAEVNASIYPWKGYGSIAEKYPTAFGKK